MNRRYRVFLLATLVSALAVAKTAAPAPAKPEPATHTIRISGFKFVPDRLEVNAGDTVIWRNEDVVAHIVSSDQLKGKNIESGGSWSYKAKERGTFSYICRYHPTMTGELSVK